MKTSRIKFNCILVALTVIFVGIVLVGNVFRANINVATIPGSYADTYANDNKLGKVELADNEKEYFDLRFEDFDFNFADDGTVTIEKYNGVSTNLVIPAYIRDTEVGALGEDFIASVTTVTDLYIPQTLARIDSDPTDKITIHCYDSAEFNILNGGEDAKWNIELMYDSDYVNFLLGDLNYRYNENENEIELLGYNGDDKTLVVPSYINGKPVTTVSFDMLGKYDLVVFPETVTSITGMTTITTVSGVWAFAMFFVGVALIATLITMNIVLPRLKKLDEIAITTPAVIVTFLYLIAQIVYSLLAIYKGIGGLGQITIVGLAMLAVYILFIVSANRGRNQAKAVAEHIEEDTAWMRELKKSIKGLSDGIEDPETKKMAKQLEEDILSMPLRNNLDKEKQEKLLKLIQELLIVIETNDEKSIKRIVKGIKMLVN